MCNRVILWGLTKFTSLTKFLPLLVYCFPCGIWIMVGSRPAVLELLHHMASSSTKKCELFWPAGDQTFPNFPPKICRPSSGLDLLGSPVCGFDDFYNSCFASKIDQTLHLHSLLRIFNVKSMHALIVQLFEHCIRAVPPPLIQLSTSWMPLMMAYGGL